MGHHLPKFTAPILVLQACRRVSSTPKAVCETKPGALDLPTKMTVFPLSIQFTPNDLFVRK